MQIKVNGHGKMGTIVRRIAETRGHQLFEQITPHTDVVCIDFTHPDAILDNIRQAASHKVSIVVGTTGWDHFLPEVKKIVADADIALFYSPNFSIGAHLHKQLCAYATNLISRFEQYQAAILETHHSQKVDAPSGTALKLQAEVHKHKSNVPITSFRHGYNPGNHTLIFDSAEDTISIEHQARNRESFALGSVLAAEWLKGKKGFFTLDDML